jgi:O-antigen ligase
LSLGNRQGALGADSSGQWPAAEPLGGLRERAGNLMVLGLLSPFLVLTARWMPKFLLGVVVLDIPLQFQVHFFFREEIAARGALGGLNFSVTTMALAGLYALWFLKAVTNRGREARPPMHLNVALTLYLAISGLSLLVAEDVSLALFECCLLLQLYLVYFYVANFVQTRQDVLFVVSLLLVGCALASLGIINIWLAGGYPPILWGRPWGLPTRVQFHDFAGAGGFMRVGGTIGSANNASGYLAFMLVLASSVLFAGLRDKHKWLAISTLAVGGVALIFTFSRGGWVAFLLSMTVMLTLFALRMRFLSWKAPLIGAAVLVLLCLPFQEAISRRLFQDDRGSAYSRIPLMKLAFRIIEDNPVLGVGSNNFSTVMDRYLIPELRSGFVFAVHNKYLLVWAETGILGILAYLTFLLGTLRRGWQCWKFQDRLLSTIGLALAAALAGHMLHMTVEVFNGRPLAQLVCLTAGLLTAMHRIGAAQSLVDSAATSLAV